MKPGMNPKTLILATILAIPFWAWLLYTAIYYL